MRKIGVAPAQHRVLLASKLIVAPCATSCSLGICSIAEVNARVTDRVICVFHAPVTFPRCRERYNPFDIVESSTIKEALKMEKVRKNLAPDLLEAVVSIFIAESPPVPLLTREHPAGKK